MVDADEEEDIFRGLYEDGIWIWCDEENQLKMLYQETVVKESLKKSVINLATGKIDFKNDIDVVEQLRFKNRYQRKVKPGEPDVVTLQDVKNLALYTAPAKMLTVQVINMLHTATTERLIRAIILYCQYFIQVKDSIDKTNSEVLRLKSTQTYVKERRFQEDLSDLRALVGNEYCSVIMGVADVRKYHHKGPSLAASSLSHKDVLFFEVLIRFIIQIVWLSLGRNSYTIVEVEISRIFKSYHYNVVEHIKETKLLTSMSKSDRKILAGESIQVHTQNQKLTTRSPMLMDAVYALGKDFRNMGLVTIDHTGLSPRLDYFKKALCLPEENLIDEQISLGILGMPRSKFDIILKLIAAAPKPDDNSNVHSKGLLHLKSSHFKQGSKKSQGSKMSAEEKMSARGKMYLDVILPPRESKDFFTIPADFPNLAKVKPLRFRNQRHIWHKRRERLLKPGNRETIYKKK